MKRLICLLFVCVLLPAVSFSDGDIYVGTWIHTEYLVSGTLQFIILDLQADHTAVAVFGKADGDDTKVPGRSFIGTWNVSLNGIHVVSGHNTSKDLVLSDGRLLESGYGLKTYYTRIK